MTGRGEFWAPVADELPGAWEKSFIDWPGLGSVPASPDANSFEDLVRLVLQQLNVPAVLVAQSMGGVVAVRVALQAPDKVSGLVLCATSGGIDVEALGGADWRVNYRRAWPAVPDWAYEKGEDLSPRLSSILVPALLVWATRDPISPLAVGKRLADFLPEATFATVDSDNHMFAAANGGVVAEMIRGHLTGR
jgi:pimeloyl-ACP methyl ester carboxylesterase